MSRFRVVAVDDEPLALGMVRDLLANDPEVELVGECGDGTSALELIRRQRPDVAFLDVEMPELGGLEVVQSLAPDELPAVVFVTAYGHYATTAFDVEALDYVVKPFSDERFFAALERAKRRVREQRLGELAEKMASLTAEIGGRQPEPVPEEPAYLTRIPVSTGDRSFIVKVEDVVWIESCDYYSRVHTAKSSHLVRVSLTAFEEQLDPRRFLRVHRGAIVHVGAVKEVRKMWKGARTLVLMTGAELRVSRSRQRRVEDVLVPKLNSSPG